MNLAAFFSLFFSLTDLTKKRFGEENPPARYPAIFTIPFLYVLKSRLMNGLCAALDDDEDMGPVVAPRGRRQSTVMMDIADPLKSDDTMLMDTVSMLSIPQTCQTSSPSSIDPTCF